MPLVFGGPGQPFRKPSANPSERRIQAASGSPFLWILSFGDAKESIAAVGPRTDIKIKPSRQQHQTNQVPRGDKQPPRIVRIRCDALRYRSAHPTHLPLTIKAFPPSNPSPSPPPSSKPFPPDHSTAPRNSNGCSCRISFGWRRTADRER